MHTIILAGAFAGALGFHSPAPELVYEGHGIDAGWSPGAKSHTYVTGTTPVVGPLRVGATYTRNSARAWTKHGAHVVGSYSFDILEFRISRELWVSEGPNQAMHVSGILRVPLRGPWVLRSETAVHSFRPSGLQGPRRAALSSSIGLGYTWGRPRASTSILGP